MLWSILLSFWPLPSLEFKLVLVAPDAFDWATMHFHVHFLFVSVHHTAANVRFDRHAGLICVLPHLFHFILAKLMYVMFISCFCGKTEKAVFGNFCSAKGCSDPSLIFPQWSVFCFPVDNRKVSFLNESWRSKWKTWIRKLSASLLEGDHLLVKLM